MEYLIVLGGSGLFALFCWKPRWLSLSLESGTVNPQVSAWSVGVPYVTLPLLFRLLAALQGIGSIPTLRSSANHRVRGTF